MIFSLIISLILTIIIELIISVLIGIKDKEDIEIVICANICTNPVVVYIANCVRRLNNVFIINIVIMTLEVMAVIVEFIIFKKYLKFKQKLPLLISIVNNVISFSIGVIINIFI